MHIRFVRILQFTGLILSPMAHASFVSYNTGSLGSAANGSSADTVTLGLGVVTAGGDQATYFNNTAGTNTVVPFLPGLNPSAGSPFTIEFWAFPTATDGDDSPVSNRDAGSANRSGWAFFQRPADTGWNLRMYSGNGSGLGWDLTGGTSTLNAWSHVVATWNGSAATLYVNGQVADSTNDPVASGIYNSNTLSSTKFLVGSTDTASPFAGAVDEIAFYSLALTPAQIQDHFLSVSNVTPGDYYSLIQNDGAQLQLSHVPEPSTAAMLGLATLSLGARRSRQR